MFIVWIREGRREGRERRRGGEKERSEGGKRELLRMWNKWAQKAEHQWRDQSVILMCQIIHSSPVSNQSLKIKWVRRKWEWGNVLAQGYWFNSQDSETRFGAYKVKGVRTETSVLSRTPKNFIKKQDFFFLIYFLVERDHKENFFSTWIIPWKINKNRNKLPWERLTLGIPSFRFEV